jgi:hypothetical protein
VGNSSLNLEHFLLIQINERQTSVFHRRLATLVAAALLSDALVSATESLFVTNPLQRLTVITTEAGATLIFDGIAYTWCPSLYENESVKKSDPHAAAVFARMGAAWLLYGTSPVL